MDLPLRNKLGEMVHLNKEWYAKLLAASEGDETTAAAGFVHNFEALPLEAWQTESGEGWEEAARGRRQRVAVERLNAAAHAVFANVFELLEMGRRCGKALDEAECWGLLRKHKWKLDEVVQALDFDFASLPPMLEEDDFGAREFGLAALFNEDRGYLAKAGRAPFESTQRVLAAVPASVDRTTPKLVKIEDRDGQQERVIVQDCIRTFVGEDHRQRLEVLLNSAYQEFGDYQQGMAHLAALLLLTLPEKDVMVILRYFNYDIVPNHWKHESDGFGTTAYVFRHAAMDHAKHIFDHLESGELNLEPTMYTRKWFCGCFIHVFDVEFNYIFLERLAARGVSYLLEVATAVLLHFEQRLLGENDIGRVLKLLAFSTEMEVTRADQKAILERAETIKLGDKLGSREDLQKLRDELYETHLRKRMEAARESLKKAQDDFEPCGVCEKKAARWTDETDDGVPLCDLCKPEREAMGHEIGIW